MFEDTVLRFSDKDRQREMAGREQELAARQANLLVRQQNLAFRQGLMTKHPQAVLDAIQTEDSQRASNKAHDEQARELKTRFGLKEHELVDTPAMRLALETALAEREVEQTQRAERIADRASLLAGLNKLALIDAQKVSEILQATKQINPPREWSRAEMADMFSNAMSWKTPSGVTKTYSKTLDGWADSLAERSHALHLAEIKLDAQEQALRAQVRRAVEGIEKAAEQAATAPAAEKAAERTVEAAAPHAVQAAAPVTAEKQPKQVDLTFERLKDPEQFAQAVQEYAARTKSSIEVAELAVGTVRDRLKRKEQGAAGNDKAEIERARAAFFAGPNAGKATSAEVAPADAAGNANVAAARSNVVAIDATKRGPDVAETTSAPEARAAGRQAADAVTGFKPLGRNRTKDAAGRGAPATGKEAGEGREQTADAAKPARVEAGRRKRFSELNAHEKIERRSEFFGNLREQAGFTRDGKQAVSEKAKEAARPGKQREGHGLG